LPVAAALAAARPTLAAPDRAARAAANEAAALRAATAVVTAAAAATGGSYGSGYSRSLSGGISLGPEEADLGTSTESRVSTSVATTTRGTGAVARALLDAWLGGGVDEGTYTTTTTEGEEGTYMTGSKYRNWTYRALFPGPLSGVSSRLADATSAAAAAAITNSSRHHSSLRRHRQITDPDAGNTEPGAGSEDDESEAEAEALLLVRARAAGAALVAQIFERTHTSAAAAAAASAAAAAAG
jgi:hypothetical protein